MQKTLSTLSALLFVVLLTNGCDDGVSSIEPPSIIYKTDKSFYKKGEDVTCSLFVSNNMSESITICRFPKSDTTKFYSSVSELAMNDIVTYSEPDSANDFIQIDANSVKLIGFAIYDSTYFNQIGTWSIDVSRNYGYNGSEFELSAWTGVLSTRIDSIIITN